ncbi:MAG: hypothetical protein ACLP2U_14995, partial [Syntrophobacteraceae bacterium]
VRRASWEIAFKCVLKEAEKLAELCPRSFERAHPLAASLLYMALRRAPSKCWATAAGAERLAARRRARPNLAGSGEVTSPLFSIAST